MNLSDRDSAVNNASRLRLRATPAETGESGLGCRGTSGSPMHRANEAATLSRGGRYEHFGHRGGGGLRARRSGHAGVSSRRRTPRLPAWEPWPDSVRGQGGSIHDVQSEVPPSGPRPPAPGNLSRHCLPQYLLCLDDAWSIDINIRQYLLDEFPTDFVRGKPAVTTGANGYRKNQSLAIELALSCGSRVSTRRMPR